MRYRIRRLTESRLGSEAGGTPGHVASSYELSRLCVSATQREGSSPKLSDSPSCSASKTVANNSSPVLASIFRHSDFVLQSTVSKTFIRKLYWPGPPMELE